MTATTSTAALFRRWLIDEVAARVEADVQVTYGMPRSIQRQAIWLVDEFSVVNEAAGFGGSRVRRTETVDHLLVIQTAVDADPAVGEDRAVGLFGVIEDVLAEQPKPAAVPGLMHAVVAGWRLNRDDTGSEGVPRVAIEVTVSASSKLT